MAHWTINHSSYTGSVTVGATPLSKNTSTSSINQTATFKMGTHSKIINLTHNGVAYSLDAIDGTMVLDWFFHMCYNCYIQTKNGTVGRSYPSDGTIEELDKLLKFWLTDTFPTVTSPSAAYIEDLEFNPQPTSEALAVMDKTDNNHKSVAPEWKFHLEEVYKNTSGGRKRILHGATVLDAGDNYKSYMDAWEAYVEFNTSGHFTAVDILYTNSTGNLSGYYDKSYRILFSSPQDSLYFDVTPSQMSVGGHNLESLMDWTFGDVNHGADLISSGAFTMEFANLYVPCVIDGLDKRINKVELITA